MANKKIILLIGKTGNGKSTLANVLYGKNDKNEYEFKEGRGARSETKESKHKEFVHEKTNYIIIDTPGICDTGSGEKEEELDREKKVYEEIVNVIYNFSTKGDGLNQVLFVTKSKFTEEEKKAYDLLKVFCNEDIAKFTTIVRTNFDEFNDPDSCKEDLEEMANGKDKLAEMVNSCNKTIHVDNPPLKGDNAKSNGKTREKSRKILLKHLANCNEVYKHEYSGNSNEELEKMERVKKMVIIYKADLNNHIKNIVLAKGVSNKLKAFGKLVALGSALVMEPTTGALGAFVTLFGKSTELGTGFVQKYLQKKYGKLLKSIDKELETIKNEFQENQDYQDSESLEKLEEKTEKCIARVEKKLNWLRTQLDIEMMYQKVDQQWKQKASF